MQIIFNIPDDLPPNIVQQYISTIEAQMSLLVKMANKDEISENKTVSLKRGSAKKMITFIAEDFNEPLEEFKDYML